MDPIAQLKQAIEQAETQFVTSKYCTTNAVVKFDGKTLGWGPVGGQYKLYVGIVGLENCQVLADAPTSVQIVAAQNLHRLYVELRERYDRENAELYKAIAVVHEFIELVEGS